MWECEDCGAEFESLEAANDYEVKIPFCPHCNSDCVCKKAVKWTYVHDSIEVSFLDDQETQRKVFEEIIGFCKKYGAWSGEHIAQSDLICDNIVEAFCDLVDDVIQPNVKYLGDE